MNALTISAMKAASTRLPVSTALRLARRSWRLQHLDSAQAIALAERALALSLVSGDMPAQARARLSRGFHLMYFATPGEAALELAEAQRCFDAAQDRAGHLLAAAGMARCQWREGNFAHALERALLLRTEGLQLLRHDERGILLNTIAGCYSALGRSEQAFAYMYQAQRDLGPARGHGFDAVLHCNLAHELIQIGDCDEALRHVDLGLVRCSSLNNGRLLSVLLINRIMCLSELNRPQEALPDIARVLALPTDASGRGSMTPHFETLAIAVLQAGNAELGAELVGRAAQAVRAPIPDEYIELAVASAMLAYAGGELQQARDHLLQALPLLSGPEADGLSLRVRCLFHLAQADVYERLSEPALALAAMRACQVVHVERTRLASRARYQAAALHTELLSLQHKLDENNLRRHATERARAELQAMNEQLSRKVEEVQALQTALKQQASRDFLTGLFNRRHLNDSLPAMLALARRDHHPLAVAILDLDHFKATNDQHGHAAGDMLLAAFGELLANHGRKSDVAFRYGGEEFCLLMPRTNALAARRKINALLRLWRHSTFPLAGGQLSGLTFSAGVIDSRAAAGPSDDLLKAADDALLAAKRSGRARVLLAEAPVGTLQ